MHISRLVPLVALLACGGEDPAGPAPVDYQVTIQSGTMVVNGPSATLPITAVVRRPDGSFARDVTVKWEASLGIYPATSPTGADSASTITWQFPVPPASVPTIRACATSPVDRACTTYSGTVTVTVM